MKHRPKNGQGKNNPFRYFKFGNYDKRTQDIERAEDNEVREGRRFHFIRKYVGGVIL